MLSVHIKQNIDGHFQNKIILYIQWSASCYSNGFCMSNLNTLLYPSSVITVRNQLHLHGRCFQLHLFLNTQIQECSLYALSWIVYQEIKIRQTSHLRDKINPTVESTCSVFVHQRLFNQRKRLHLNFRLYIIRHTNKQKIPQGYWPTPQKSQLDLYFLNSNLCYPANVRTVH